MSLRALIVVIVGCFAVSLITISAAGAACFSCSETCGACCPAGGGCIYIHSTGSCSTYCDGGGGGSPGPSHPPVDAPVDPSTMDCDYDFIGGEWVCTPGLTSHGDEPSTESVSLDAMLNAVSSTSGLPIIAPAVKKHALPARVAGEDFARVIGRIAAEVGAVPVIRGSIDAIELVPVGDLEKRRFAKQPASADMRITAEFIDTDVLQVTRLIARQTRQDIVLPEGFSGRINGSFNDRDWKEVLQAVANASRAGGRLKVSPNGLVRLAP